MYQKEKRSTLYKCLESGCVSLRTSSVFVNGAARVYRDETEQLYRDCIKLNKEMMRRNKRPPIEVIESDSKSTDKDSSKSNRKRSNPYPRQRSENKRNGTNGLEKNLSQTDRTRASRHSSTTTKDIGVQTTKSFISNRSKKYPRDLNVDVDQPFALVMVYDTQSRVPSKFIYSNINVNSI